MTLIMVTFGLAYSSASESPLSSSILSISLRTSSENPIENGASSLRFSSLAGYITIDSLYFCAAVYKNSYDA